MIDDFVSMTIEARCPEEVKKSPSESARLADKVFELYKSIQLIPREEKSTRDATQAEFLVVSIDGVRGTMRAAPLMKVLTSVLEIGATTVRLLEIFARGVISLFVPRRRLLALLDQVYAGMKDRPQDMALRRDLQWMLPIQGRPW